MSRQKGMLITCDICGASVHLKTIGDGETDGGYTRWNKFENTPEGWSQKIKIHDKAIDACPKCTAKYDTLYLQLISELKGKKEMCSNDLQRL